MFFIFVGKKWLLQRDSSQAIQQGPTPLRVNDDWLAFIKRETIQSEHRIFDGFPSIAAGAADGQNQHRRYRQSG
ncbi:hypothetical protein [Parathalassolituus penaei]|uniref:Uncharacterized protein n=1 Tax=Parathalassolituus penaei TaxID=2997323 RepID=A0A9X3EL63_9GAMM|nr:hypothetical protein [Parathalassolituus penaei]MCY0964663.1 hypothetical protein [Parathalassolituus penaei]